MNELKDKISEVLLAKQAHDLVIIDFQGQSSLLDYFLICSAGNLRQMEALSDAVAQYCRKQNIPIKSIQGQAVQGWILIDLKDIVIHIFDQATRELYQLEKLWSTMKVERFDVSDTR